MPPRPLFLGFALCLLGGATAHAASTPEGFAAVAGRGDRVDIQGLGFGESGKFRLSDGSAVGTYKRSSTSRTWAQGIGDTASHSRTHGDARLVYTLDDGRKDGPLSADCDAAASADQISVGSLSIGGDLKPFGLSCVLRRGGQVVGDLSLRAAPSTGLMAQERREGEVRIGGQSLRLTSVHRFEGGKLPTASPLGYLLTQDDRVIGAVDVNGWRARRLALPRSPELRDAALAAGLVLALQWSPQTEN